MAMVGEDIALSEDVYQRLIGQYAAAVEVLNRRIAAKDQHIVELESKLEKKNGGNGKASLE